MMPTIPGKSISQYLTYVNAIPSLSAEEETGLLENIQDGCKDSAQKLILHHLKFVSYVAKKYSCSKVPMEDLIQEGNVALMKAVKNFNLSISRGVRFVSFAVHHIKSAILQYIYKNFKMLDIATTKEHKKIFNNSSMFSSSLLDMDEAKYIASTLNVSLDSVIDMHARLNLQCQSVIMGEDGVYDVLPIEDNRYSPHVLIEDWSQKTYDDAKFNECILSLNERDRKILALRWLTEDKKTQTEVGKILNISHERVRQLEQKIFLKMRNALTDK